MLTDKIRFRSLRQKMLIIYIGINIGTFFLLSSILPSIISWYYQEDQSKVLARQAEVITQRYNAPANKVFKLDLILELGRYFNEVNETDMFLIDIITSTVYRLENNEHLPEIIESGVFAKALAGISSEGRGGIPGLNGQYLYNIRPLYNDNKVTAILFIGTNTTLINKSVRGMQMILTFVLAISLLVAMILILILSKDIIDPINMMNKAAKKMSGGNFNTRIKIKNEDEIGQLAESFNNMSSELGKLEELRSAFIANISHDFRSPLTSIRGFVQAILDGTIPPEMHEKYLNVVLDETTRLTNMTNNILHLTKMEAKQITLERRNFDINEVLRKVLIGMEQKINQKEIQVEMILSDEKLFVNADLEQIQRAIYNLVDNAVKFVGSGDSIFIETAVVKKKAHISIIDTGPGIEEASLNKIFDRFHKGDSSRGVDKKGTGLGLAIVREIIRQHGEEISVASRAGEGTAFTFTLPIGDKG